MIGEGFSFSGFERDAVYFNRGNKTFVDLSGVSGMDSITDGRAAVFADFDNDGDPDVFLRTMHSEAHLLFRNNIGARSGGFVRVALRGTKSGTDAFGAIVRVRAAERTVAQAKTGGSGFLSQGDPRLLFGLGDSARADSIEIRWPSGLVQSFPGVDARTSWLATEGEPALTPVVERPFSLPDAVPDAPMAWSPYLVQPDAPLPALALRRLDGTPAPADALGGRSGRKLLVNFWATWCAPCAREMPQLQALAATGRVDVVGISVDETASADEIRAAAERAGARYPMFHAEPSAVAAIFPSGAEVPVSFLLDERGRVVDVISGASRAARTRLDALGSRVGIR